MNGRRGIPGPTLFWGTATAQMIGWGTLYTPFALMVGPIEAELGWSRVLLNAAFTCSLLASGVAAVPAGRWLDRHGPRAMMSLGAFAAVALLVAMSLVHHPAAYVAIWVLIGVAQALCLWAPAMAVVVAEAQEPTRTITAITFVTGFTGTVFIPVISMLIDTLGWRGALQVLAAMQFVAAVVTLAMLREARVPAAPHRDRPPPSLWRRIREPAFLGLAVCYSAHAFIATGLGAHLIPLLRERGWPEATVLLLAAAHGPAQVTARALLYAAGRRVTMRRVGRFATALAPVAMLCLAAGAASLPLTIAFVACWAISDGLLTIIRAAGTAEILGREGYGAVSGALTAVSIVPRTGAPLILALLWDSAGGYGPVAWMLIAAALVATAGFQLAAAAQSDVREAPAPPPT